MNVKIFFLILASGLLTIIAQNISPQFSELKGIVDNTGNTHLFYRIYSSANVQYNFSTSSNSIYDLNLTNLTDEVYLYDGSYCNGYIGSGINIYDYEIWNGDLQKYIYCGQLVNCFEPYGFVSRYDTINVLGDMFLNVNKIDISKQNDSLVLVGPMMLKSIDGGISWDTLSLNYSFLSLSPLNDNIIFAEIPYQINQTALYKSINGGNTFSIVDTGRYWNTEFFYDIDGNHVYRYSSVGYPNVSLKASFNQGNAFTWSTIYNSNRHFYVSLDPSLSGSIYLADGKRIFRSTNYGNWFSLFNEIDKKIIGIYKKPNSNKLYAASKYKIYEITMDSIKTIKSLPLPQEIRDYYPLKIGNEWVYNYVWYTTPVTGTSDIYLRKITNEVLKPNGKKYFEIKEKYVLMGFENTVYERVDTAEGKIYRYEEFCPGSEQFIDDLIIEVGDSTFATRFGFCIEHPPTEFTSEIPFNKWGISSNERKYLSCDLLSANYSLVRDIGLYSFTLADDNGEKVYQLKGMVKNGVVYGDTSLIVGIKDEDNQLPTEFNLSQNHPNPFNPSTKIKYAISSKQYATIKVYDILGNEIETLVNEEKSPGTYEVTWNAVGLPSGVYFYQLCAGSLIETKKMILLR